MGPSALEPPAVLGGGSKNGLQGGRPAIYPSQAHLWGWKQKITLKAQVSCGQNDQKKLSKTANSSWVDMKNVKNKKYVMSPGDATRIQNLEIMERPPIQSIC